MSYNSQAQLSVDQDFINRVAACAAVEVQTNMQPTAWAYENVWRISAAPGFADAYEYALNTGVESPGKDPAVITDAQILAAVQYLITPPTPEPEEEPVVEET